MGLTKVVLSAFVLTLLAFVGIYGQEDDIAYFPDLEKPGELIEANLEPLSSAEFIPAEEQDASLIHFLLYTR